MYNTNNNFAYYHLLNIEALQFLSYNFIGDNMNNINDIKVILKKYIKTRLLLIILIITASIILPYTDNIYNTVFELFDNEHYLNIAKNGYQHNYEYAFFPLTAIIIKFFGKIGFIIINQLCVIASGYLLYLLSKNTFKTKNHYFATTLWFISPIAIFTCMFYSEALFIFLTLLAYYLYKNQKHYFSLGIVLGLSVLTRNLGSMLFFTIFIFMFIKMLRKKEKFRNILITYIPATIISCLYPIYLYLKTNNPLYFIDVQFDYWWRVNTNIFKIMFDSFKLLLSNPNIFFVFNFLLTFALIGYIIYLIFKGKKQKNYYDMYLYMLLTIISICSTIRGNPDATASFYRYIYGCFPIYFLIPHKKWCYNTQIFLSTCITIIFLAGIYFY